jgi:hypothetical protein
MERIAHACIRRLDGVIALGRSHCEIINSSPFGTCKTNNRADQGFVTSEGRFVSRLEAKEIAYKSGQIPLVHYKLINHVGLISENLWSDNNFSYRQDIGYCKYNNDNEVQCPICEADMKEFITIHRCRDLECRFKYKRSY